MCSETVCGTGIAGQAQCSSARRCKSKRRIYALLSTCLRWLQDLSVERYLSLMPHLLLQALDLSCLLALHLLCSKKVVVNDVETLVQVMIGLRDTSHN